MTGYVTHGGKSIILKPVEGSSLIRIVFESGGELPPEFEGAFTDATSAKKAIEKYLLRTAPKPKKQVA